MGCMTLNSKGFFCVFLRGLCLHETEKKDDESYFEGGLYSVCVRVSVWSEWQKISDISTLKYTPGFRNNLAFCALRPAGVKKMTLSLMTSSLQGSDHGRLERLPSSLLVLAHTFINSLPAGILALHCIHQVGLRDMVPCIFVTHCNPCICVPVNVQKELYCLSEHTGIVSCIGWQLFQQGWDKYRAQLGIFFSFKKEKEKKLNLETSCNILSGIQGKIVFCTYTAPLLGNNVINTIKL